MRKLNDKVAWIRSRHPGRSRRFVQLLEGGVADDGDAARWSDRERVVVGRKVQAEDCGEIIAFIAKMPPHICINELTVSPTWNRGFVAQAKALTR